MGHSAEAAPATLLSRPASRPWGSDADADLAEDRFKKRLADYRSDRRAPPAKWLLPGSCLAEVLAAAAGQARRRR